MLRAKAWKTFWNKGLLKFFLYDKENYFISSNKTLCLILKKENKIVLIGTMKLAALEEKMPVQTSSANMITNVLNGIN